jgi:hypothetical protein
LQWWWLLVLVIQAQQRHLITIAAVQYPLDWHTQYLRNVCDLVAAAACASVF